MSIFGGYLRLKILDEEAWSVQVKGFQDFPNKKPDIFSLHSSVKSECLRP